MGLLLYLGINYPDRQDLLDCSANGAQNLDVITFDAVKNTLDVEVYILK